MKKKIGLIILFILLVALATFHSFSFTNLYSFDEIWNYGFGKNILDGLVPYRDFNMIIPPLFSYLVALVLKIFGEKLIVYHIFLACLVTEITYLSYKKIGWYSILIYIALLIYCTNGYNLFTLFVLFLLLQTIEKKPKNQEFIIPILISMMFLTKQTLGILILPSILYSKNKKKTIAIYLVIALSFLSYLLINNSLFQFIDYCFLGMFEFTEKNYLSVLPYLIIELCSCAILLKKFMQSKGTRKDICYVLLYQIIVFPIVDISHFVLGWSSILYLLFKQAKATKMFKISAFIVILTMELSVLSIADYSSTLRGRSYLEPYPGSGFLEGRLVPIITKDYLHSMGEYIQKYPEHRLYILGNYGYLVKLALDIPITKYDLINDGNMGYHGSQKYIEEIKETCREEQCLFIVNDNEHNKKGYGQTNYQILEYVSKNYQKIYASSTFGIYIN